MVPLVLLVLAVGLQLAAGVRAAILARQVGWRPGVRLLVAGAALPALLFVAAWLVAQRLPSLPPLAAAGLALLALAVSVLLFAAVVGLARSFDQLVMYQTKWQEGEERYRRMVGGTFGAVALHEGGKIVDANPAFAKMFGLEPGEIIGIDALELAAPQSRNTLESTLLSPTDTTREVAFRRRDGSTVVAEVRGRSSTYQGRPVQVTEARDVSDLWRSEAESARLASALEQTAEAVVIVSDRGKIVYVNPAFERISGYARAEVEERDWSMLTRGGQDRELGAEIVRAVAGGETWKGSFPQRRKDGTVYDAEGVISPVRDDAGRIVNYVGVQRDVTRERELENQLRQAQKLEAVGQLSAGIAHDFNNILSVVLSNAELALAAVPPEQADLRGELDDLSAAARSGATMVKKLLAFSRQAQLTLAPTDLGAVLAELSAMLHHVLPSNIDVQIAAATGLPPACADAGAVQQIILNLATNARDAMPGGGTLCIRTERATLGDEYSATHPWVRPGEYLCVVVTDNGVGMDQQTRERIFEPFFTTKAPGKGTGLGMAMIHGLVKQHSGLVHVYSEVGRGTAIRVYLPVAEQPAGAAAGQRASVASPGGSETILLVEDEDAMRRTGQRILERFGYTVLTAKDGEDGLRVYEANEPRVDLVLSDMMMPKLDGRGLYEELRRRGKHVRFVFASGYAADAEPGAGRQPIAGALSIQKPWTLNELAGKIRQALDSPSGN
jgi:two-component system cell cycle sensor histidine kinase/response regulator CckA